jgi:hypothetical protein
MLVRVEVRYFAAEGRINEEREERGGIIHVCAAPSLDDPRLGIKTKD